MRYKSVTILLFVFLFMLVVGSQYSFGATEKYSILVDDFNKKITYNLLGGKAQGDEELPGGCVPSFTTPPILTKGLTKHSLRLDYDVTIPGSFSFYYTMLGKDIGGETRAITPLDLSKYDYLSMYVKSPIKNLRFKIVLWQDADNDQIMILGRDTKSVVRFPNYYDYSEDKIDTWQKVVVPLEDFTGIKDFSKMLEVALTWESAAGEKQGTILLDDILFGKGLKKALAVDDSVVFKAPYADTLKNNNLILLEGSILRDKNFISVEAPSRRQEARLESVRFEYSPDKGKTWYAIDTDYDLNDNIYMVEWDTKGLNEKASYWLRAVTCSIKGKETTGTAVKNLHIRYSK